MLLTQAITRRHSLLKGKRRSGSRGIFHKAVDFLHRRYNMRLVTPAREVGPPGPRGLPAGSISARRCRINRDGHAMRQIVSFGRRGDLGGLNPQFRSVRQLTVTKIRISCLGLLGTAAFILAFTGCAKSTSNEPPAPLAPPVDPSTAATITGTVKFEGTAPVLRPIDMGASPACMGVNPKPVVPPVVITGAHDALANAVVFVKSGLGHYRYPAPQTPVTLDQKGCMYVPRVVALMVGQPFQVANNDPTLHDIQPVLRNNPPWSLSELPGRPPVHATFQYPEFAAYVGCMIHPWMRAYLFVFDQPYFEVTSKDGAFALKNLPPGTYTIEAWHEPNQTLDQTVTLAPKESKEISLTFHSGS